MESSLKGGPNAHVSIRPMAYGDLESVIKIEQNAFDAEGLIRTKQNVIANWKDSEDGCFAAETEGELAGFIFSHAWGRVGWIGTLVVIEKYRGNGIGTMLLSRTIEYLLSRGCTTIGLETYGGNLYDIGFYTKNGFHPNSLTLMMSKNISPKKGEMLSFKEWSEIGSTERKSCMESVKYLSSLVRPGMDYSKRVAIMADAGESRLLFFGSPIWGFASVRATSKFEGQKLNTLVVERMVIHPSTKDSLNSVLFTLEQMALEWGFARILLYTNTKFWWGLQRLYSLDFQIEGMLIRLVYREEEPDPDGINISNWDM